MKKTNLTLAIIGATIMFASCKKDEQVITPAVTSGTSIQNNMSQLFKTNEDLLTQSFTIDPTQYQYVYGARGTSVMFPPNSLQTKSGGSVTGNVTIKLIEIFDKASMVLTNKSTNGRLANGKTSTLISGGEFKVTAEQGGQELELKPGKSFMMKAPGDNTGGVDNQMDLFDGNFAEQDMIWEEIGDSVDVVADSAFGGSGMGYSWSDSTFGWTNIDKFYSDSRPKTTIHVTVPTGYDKSNCEVFLAYEGEKTALASFDTYNTTTKRFTEHYGLIPIGLKVHFIFVTEDNGLIKSEIHSTTITANHVEAITSPQVISKSQLTIDILALP